MKRAVIAEGPRGTGKSSTMRLLRDCLKDCTLINPTGFSLDGVQGLEKAWNYYHAWFSFFEHLKGDHVILMDRLFFTEMVFSELYKDYDFSPHYGGFAGRLPSTFDRIDILNFTVSDYYVVEQRLKREKTSFGEEDGLAQYMKLELKYDELFKNLEYKYEFIPNVHFWDIDTFRDSPAQIRDYILDKLELRTP